MFHLQSKNRRDDYIRRIRSGEKCLIVLKVLEKHGQWILCKHVQEVQHTRNRPVYREWYERTLKYRNLKSATQLSPLTPTIPLMHRCFSNLKTVDESIINHKCVWFFSQAGVPRMILASRCLQGCISGKSSNLCYPLFAK